MWNKVLDIWDNFDGWRFADHLAMWLVGLVLLFLFGTALLGFILLILEHLWILYLILVISVGAVFTYWYEDR